jgi:hypothetical protein
VGKRYFQTNPAKLLLVREEVDPMRPDQYQTENTIGLALHIAGNGAHVRFSGDAGLHAINTPDDPESGNPNVLVFTASESLSAYCPQTTVVRKGFLKDRVLRRKYDIGKGEMHDCVLDRTWTGMRGHLASWLEPAISANTRLRLLRLIVE